MRLILIRHAKSSWKYPQLEDHDRPLNKRGARDAPRMAAWLAEREPQGLTLVSSSAARAHTLAQEIARCCNWQLRVDPDLYTFSRRQLLDCLRELGESYGDLAIVGHNPAITSAVNYLMARDQHAGFDNVPTSGIVALQAVGREAFSAGSFELDYYMWPKMLA